MTRRFDYYYLQRNAGASWDTVEEAQSITVLNLSLADQLETPGDAEIRIVGALYDVHSEAWAYEQLFYIDQSSIDLGTGEPAPPEPNLDPHSERDNKLAHNSGGVGDGGTGEDGDVDIESEWRKLDGEDYGDTFIPSGKSADRSVLYKRPSFNFDEPAAKNNLAARIIKGVAIFLILVTILSGGAIGAGYYFQHPLLLDTADKLGIGEYVRMTESRSIVPNVRSLPSKTIKDPVKPFTTGQVVRFSGVAPALQGRWSPHKCEMTFIEFTENTYHRAIDGQRAASPVIISETLMDDFQYYLRRSPNMVEHFKIITPKDIQSSGMTTESGFLASAERAEIYRRCP